MALCTFIKSGAVNLTKYFDCTLRHLFKMLYSTNDKLNPKTTTNNKSDTITTSTSPTRTTIDTTSTPTETNITPTPTTVTIPHTVTTSIPQDPLIHQQGAPPSETVCTTIQNNHHQTNASANKHKIYNTYTPQSNKNKTSNQTTEPTNQDKHQEGMLQNRSKPPHQVHPQKAPDLKIHPSPQTQNNSITPYLQKQLQQLLQSSSMKQTPNNLLGQFINALALSNTTTPLQNTIGVPTNVHYNIASNTPTISTATHASNITNQTPQSSSTTTGQGILDGVDFNQDIYIPEECLDDEESVATAKDSKNEIIIKHVAGQLSQIVPKITYELYEYHIRENKQNITKAEVNAYFESVKTSSTTMIVAKALEQDPPANHNTLKQLVKKHCSTELKNIQKNFHGGKSDRILPPPILRKTESPQQKPNNNRINNVNMPVPPATNGIKWIPPNPQQHPKQQNQPYHYSSNPDTPYQQTTEQYQQERRKKINQQQKRHERHLHQTYQKRYTRR